MSVCDIKLGTSASGQAPSSTPHTHDGAPAHSHSHEHSHSAAPGGDHGHTHEIMDHPGKFGERDLPDFSRRNWEERAFTVGHGGPVGSGKTALTLAICKRLRDKLNIGVVTNDIFTREDQEFLIRNSALDPPSRIRAVETGGCVSLYEERCQAPRD